MNKLEHVAETVGTDVLHVIESPAKLVADLSKTVAVLGTVLAAQKGLKTVLTEVATDGIKISAELAAVIAAKGTSWVEDAALVQSIEQFFARDIEAGLIPEVEAIYGAIKIDIEQG